jgi:hypothetical protein
MSYVEFDGIDFDASLSSIKTGAFALSTNDPNYPQPHHVRLKNAEVKAQFCHQGVDCGPGQGGALILDGAHEMDGAQGASEFINLKLHGANESSDLIGLGTIGGGYCIYVSGPNNLVERNIMYDCWTYAVHVYNVGGDSADNNIIRQNEIYGILRNNADTQANKVSGIIVANSNFNRIYNNVVRGVGSGNGGAIEDFGSYDTQIYNNTLYGNSLSAIRLYETFSAIVRNNIAYGNASNTIENFNSTVTQSNNLTDGTNPQFVDAGTGDFHLTAMSTASIDTGVCLGTVPTDADGVARPQGPGCDRGAYEYLVGGGNIPGIPANIFPANGATNVVLFPPPLSFTSTNATAYDFSFSPYNGQSDAFFTDLFDGANSSDIGTFWTPFTVGSTNAQRFNNHVRSVTTALVSAERAIGVRAPNQWARMRLSTFGTGIVSVGFFLRLQGTVQPSGYFIGAATGYPSGYHTWAYRYDNGNMLFLDGESATPWASNDFIEAHIVGNTITIYRNGNTDVRLTASDPDALYASGDVGIALYSDPLGQVEIDNFEAGDIGPVFQGTFSTASFPLTGLMPAQTYYWKPAGRNSTGVTEGAINTFTTETSSVPVTPIGVRLRFKSP